MSPFRSEKQRRFLFAKKPALARRWARKYGAKPLRKKVAEGPDSGQILCVVGLQARRVGEVLKGSLEELIEEGSVSEGALRQAYRDAIRRKLAGMEFADRAWLLDILTTSMDEEFGA